MEITATGVARPRRSTAGGPRRRRSRRAAMGGLLAATGMAATLTMGSSGSARAEPGDLIVFKTDPSGDVTTLPRKGPGKVARASIDLRSVALVEEAGGVQMTISLQRILTNSKYNQVVEVQMKPADATELWFLDVSMNGQQPALASASYSPDLSGSPQVCKQLTAAVDDVADTLSVTVPDLCLPTDAAKIRVFSSLVKPSGVAFSLDKLPVRGNYLMHG